MESNRRDMQTPGLQTPGLQTIVEREAALLAPFAMHSADSAGRQHPEPEHSYRGPFQRDRDRILHSAAFRRLSGKMQVFTGDRGDYHRTRLTHTMEVASIARTMGRSLKLNEDLIEALALLHDLGHPPFGHAGEEALNDALRDEGGFSHNRYALTLVEEIERPYAQFSGLNLTHEVLDAQTIRADKSTDAPAPLMEAQVVDVADSITYDAHDTDDAVKLGLVTLDELLELSLMKDCVARVRARQPAPVGQMLRKAVVHELIDCQVSAVLQHCGPVLRNRGWQSPDDARRGSFRIGVQVEMARQKEELEAFLRERVYRHPDLIRVRRQAQRRLCEMLDGLIQHPDRLPRVFRSRAAEVGLRRSAADYLAGMTDRFYEQQYRRYF